MSRLVGFPVGAISGFFAGSIVYQLKSEKGRTELFDNGELGLGFIPGIVGIVLGGIGGTICATMYSKRFNNSIVGGLVGGIAGGAFIGTIMN